MWLKSYNGKQKVKELSKEIKEANNSYYNSDTPVMSDQEYDLKVEKLKALEEKYEIPEEERTSQKVGAPVLAELAKVEITPRPMLSLAKCHSAEEIEDFFDNNHDIIASLKCDGLSVRVKYKDGELYSANTRGNGTIGTDITEHVRYFRNVPTTIGISGEYIIDGEAVIKYSDFEIVNKNNEFKNPRNTAAGALNLLNMEEVKNKRISFIAWEVIQQGDTDEPTDSRAKRLQKALSLGFETVPYCTPHFKHDDIDEINAILGGWGEDIPSDGTVWKYDDVVYGESLGTTSHHPKDGIAWKPEVETAETRLRYIQWQVGRGDILTPVAVFDPVELDGSTIERASLHNYSVMREKLGPCAYAGEPLTVFKANMIIPQILEAGPFLEYGDVIAGGGVSANDEPETCPVCGGEIGKKTSPDGTINYICLNPYCQGKILNRLVYFCGKKGLDIKGLSEATLDKLYEWGWVNSFEDIFKLKDHEKEWITKPGFGEKSVNKILAAIEESKNASLESFIAALGIPLIGRNVTKEICKHISSFNDLVELIESNYNFAVWDSFGPEKSDALLSYDYEEAQKLLPYMNFEESKPEEENKLKGITVCITGKLNNFKNRAELQQLIEHYGGKVTGSVSSKTTCLINNDIESTTGKNETAKKLGIPILSEVSFIEKYLQ